ncbi:hypothetical protein NEOLEDRAFT_1103554 [Neolentinus lepideus HHB14362 ss-1]|uniref:Protein-S-isoprenylcysteine O-methyltransferase n=1 Tax=Neolentinus lepideus HHB14362 ss-1 TaxID=1314782 RepID=A0A165MI92_9AGAM|nr:hypothetical protein NEOLEDRAFT_1103554 [Neolentinus lepideus HHB14362 ss-1]
MSLPRVPLLLLATAGLHRCLTNPNPPASDDDVKRYAGSVTFSARIITWWPNLLKYGLWTGALCESAVLLSTQFPNPPYTTHLLSTLTPSPSSVPRIRLTTPFLVGTALAAFGSFIRYQCYRTLGRHFTYQLSFREDQKLVTDGPYAWVRHPSYSAFVVAFTGICLCWFSEGSWLRECGILDTLVGKAVVALSLIGGLGLDYVCLFRPKSEDVAMRKQFGEQWDEWAKKVPYRLFPYIY